MKMEGPVKTELNGTPLPQRNPKNQNQNQNQNSGPAMAAEDGVPEKKPRFGGGGGGGGPGGNQGGGMGNRDGNRGGRNRFQRGGPGGLGGQNRNRMVKQEVIFFLAIIQNGDL